MLFNSVYLIDALEGLSKLQENSVDLLVTDPPYIWNHSTGGLSTSSVITAKWGGTQNLLAGGKTANINNSIKFKEWLPAVYRVLKNPSHSYIFINDKNLEDILREAKKVGFKLHNVLVWRKNNKTPNNWYMKNCEFVAFFHKGKSFRINNNGSAQLLEFNNIPGKKKLHPTQKPVELLKNLILNSSQPGQIVLDPFMGSGSTACAALETGRKFLGFENDPKFVEVATSRLENLKNSINYEKYPIDT